MQFIRVLVCLCYVIVSTVLANPTIETNFSHRGEQLHFDFPEVYIGEAEYPQGPTGVTVFYFPKGATAAVDLRGGAIGSFFTQVKMQCGYAPVDAVVFSGGSILGLASVTGVLDGLFEKNNYNTDFDAMPLVSGVSIFDFTVRKPNAIYPDMALGKAALKNAAPGQFLLGRRGAGASAIVGKLYGQKYAENAGQGGAFAQFGDIKLAFFTVLNPVGVVVDYDNKKQYGLWNQAEQRYLSVDEIAESELKGMVPPGGNTTLSILITNLTLSPFELQQLGKQVHNSMSSWIKPFCTINDGDIFYTVSTNSLPARSDVSSIWLGVEGTKLAKQGIFSAFNEKGHP